jgi:hypothetical protein
LVLINRSQDLKHIASMFRIMDGIFVRDGQLPSLSLLCDTDVWIKLNQRHNGDYYKKRASENKAKRLGKAVGTAGICEQLVEYLIFNQHRHTIRKLC